MEGDQEMAARDLLNAYSPPPPPRSLKSEQTSAKRKQSKSDRDDRGGMFA